MRAKFAKTVLAAAAAGAVVTAGVGVAGPALGASGQLVPCSASALSSAMTGATSGEVLQLAKGCTYVLSTALPDVSVNLTLQASGNFTTIERSSAGGTPNFSLLTVTSGARLTANNVNFRNGSSPGNFGGAIYGVNGSITVNGGTFSGNLSFQGYGGAIDAELGTLTVKGATFTGNTSGYGGAIDFGTNGGGSVTGSTFSGNKAAYGGGAVSAFHSITVNSSTFTGNTVPGPGNEGGALYVGRGTTTAAQDTFTRNSADLGGGIANESSAAPGLVVKGGYFKQNTATSGGGAIYNDDDMTLTGSVFSYNHSANYGGAVDSTEEATVTGTTFANNSATYGGGYYNNPEDLTLSGGSFSGNTAGYGGGLANQSTATVSGTSFSQNTATTAGGGIWESGTSLALTNSQVEQNHAPPGQGGGIYNGDTVTLTSTTVMWNRANNCSPLGSVTGCTG
jgi:predicted outer membrane repeat protein